MTILSIFCFYSCLYVLIRFCLSFLRFKMILLWNSFCLYWIIFTVIFHWRCIYSLLLKNHKLNQIHLDDYMFIHFPCFVYIKHDGFFYIPVRSIHSNIIFFRYVSFDKILKGLFIPMCICELGVVHFWKNEWAIITILDKQTSSLQYCHLITHRQWWWRTAFGELLKWIFVTMSVCCRCDYFDHITT